MFKAGTVEAHLPRGKKSIFFPKLLFIADTMFRNGRAVRVSKSRWSVAEIQRRKSVSVSV